LIECAVFALALILMLTATARLQSLRTQPHRGRGG
jgi:hypothetical protein